MKRPHEGPTPARMRQQGFNGQEWNRLIEEALAIGKLSVRCFQHRQSAGFRESVNVFRHSSAHPGNFQPATASSSWSGSRALEKLAQQRERSRQEQNPGPELRFRGRSNYWTSESAWLRRRTVRGKRTGGGSGTGFQHSPGGTTYCSALDGTRVARSAAFTHRWEGGRPITA